MSDEKRPTAEQVEAARHWLRTNAPGAYADFGAEWGEAMAIVMVLYAREAVAAERERLHSAINEECSCGGMGPRDPGVCAACRVWHRIRARGSSGAKGGGA